jgi:hypothetical protein
MATPTAGHGHAVRRDLLVSGGLWPYKLWLEGHAGRTNSDIVPGSRDIGYG